MSSGRGPIHCWHLHPSFPSATILLRVSRANQSSYTSQRAEPPTNSDAANELVARISSGYRSGLRDYSLASPMGHSLTASN